MESIEKVLCKREVQNAIITGIQLDMLAERGINGTIANDYL